MPTPQALRAESFCDYVFLSLRDTMFALIEPMYFRVFFASVEIDLLNEWNV